ncbi:DUF805 domain-containing protein [Chitinibacter sp. ZOR0017]|uniref:DUF805 domain-containing protein n=1 Tax=Chitinibacter sp. ZOR0017 TaxID=1339254 RepID=UPI000647DABA|nr:DUF805 domain-containing protein [Chitinibacter sp. ZOR0017]
MTFLQAVQRGFQQLTNFSGRATRAEFWWWALFQLMAYLAITLTLGHQLAGTLLLLALAVPSLAVGVRRLHDIGRSGRWVVLCLLPVLGWLTMLYWHTRPSGAHNQFGPRPEFQ